MSTEYRYFQVKGGAALAAHNKWLKQRTAEIAALKAVKAKYGASGSYGNDRGVVGLLFKKGPPTGWRPCRDEPTAFRPPLGKAGKAIIKELAALKMSGAAEYHKLLSPKNTLGFFDMPDSGTGFRLRFIVFEKHGDALVLLVPICADGKKWNPPDEHCVPLKTSQYWALKEANE